MSILNFNDEMWSFLQFAQKDSIIAAVFLQGDTSHINDEGNYIKRVDNEIDVVSFLPNGTDTLDPGLTKSNSLSVIS